MIEVIRLGFELLGWLNLIMGIVIIVWLWRAPFDWRDPFE